MSYQSQGSPGGQEPSPSPAPEQGSYPANIPTPTANQSEHCPGCGDPVQPGQAICATCGAHLHSKPKEIRCRRCGRRASSAYHLCPHCGRELTAGLPRWLSRGVPALLLFLIVAVVASQLLAGPGGWLQQRIGETAAVVENPVLTPVRGEEGESAPPAIDAPPTATPVAEALAAATGTPTPSATATALPPATETATATTTTTPSATATDVPTETATSTQSPTGTSTSTSTGALTSTSITTSTTTLTSTLKAILTATPPTKTPTATPTETPTADLPTATPTTSPTSSALAQQQRYTVVSGDTFVGIALRFNISTEALMAANGMGVEQARDLRPGQELVIPGRSQPLPPTATPTPGLRRYTVQPGDTMVGIAARNGISAELLLAANRMTAAQAPNIRPGDELLIPPPGYVPPTPTPRPTTAPSATPTPRITIRLDAPTLVDPAPDVNVSCSPNKYVTWNAVNGIAPGDEYVLFLGYVNSAPDSQGNVEVVPLLEQRTKRTNWAMDPAFCNLAPQSYGRRWRWYVQVFEDDTPVSPRSETREFTWR